MTQVTDVAAERDRTARVRLVASSCAPARPAEVPDRYLSHKCADGRWHSGCAGAGAAWDFILDHALNCDCDCHREPATH